MGAGIGHVELLEKQWYWAKKLQLKPEELRNEVLLSKNKHGETSWYMATRKSNVEVLEKLSDWAKELQLESEELRREDVFVKRQVRRDGMAYGRKKS